MDNNQNETFEKAEIFSSPEDLAASIQADAPQQESAGEQPSNETIMGGQAPPTGSVVEGLPAEEAPAQEAPGEPQQQGTNEVQRETAEPETNTQQGYSDDEVETAVMSFLSEKLGREVTSLDDLSATQQAEANALDERVQAIAQFVEDTGRAPEDWFRYQSLNPESMDDMTAVRVQMANEYPNLSYEELDLLTKSKYKLDADLHDEAELKLSQLQLKIDGQKAREGVEQIRQKYSAPDTEQAAPGSVFDDKWVSDMSREVDSIEGLEFDLGGEKTFEFGLDDNYKSQLKTKNARLNEYFDSYVRDDGSWDYESLSTHVALVDNIDKIIKSVYTQGLGDGQKTLVNTAANISTQSPQQGSQNNQTSPLADQVRQLISKNNKMSFNNF
jgi:hypothetical protein